MSRRFYGNCTGWSRRSELLTSWQWHSTGCLHGLAPSYLAQSVRRLSWTVVAYDRRRLMTSSFRQSDWRLLAIVLLPLLAVDTGTVFHLTLDLPVPSWFGTELPRSERPPCSWVGPSSPRSPTIFVVWWRHHSDNQTGDCWRSCFHRCWQPGSRLWNSLPPDIRSAQTLHVFCNRLKTYLFSKCFPS